MADQAPSDSVAVAGQGQAAGPTAAEKAALAAATGAADSAAHGGHHGRPVSWASVVIMIVGFLVGGAGMVFGPTWWLFWAGCGLTALGGFLALGTGIFNDWY